MGDDLELVITSPPESEDLIAELWCRNRLWGAVSLQGTAPVLTLYGDFTNGSLPMRIEAVQSLLKAAKDRLEQMYPARCKRTDPPHQFLL